MNTYWVHRVIGFWEKNDWFLLFAGWRFFFLIRTQNFRFCLVKGQISWILFTHLQFSTFSAGNEIDLHCRWKTHDFELDHFEPNQAWPSSQHGQRLYPIHVPGHFFWHFRWPWPLTNHANLDQSTSFPGIFQWISGVSSFIKILKTNHLENCDMCLANIDLLTLNMWNGFHQWSGGLPPISYIAFFRKSPQIVICG